MFQSIKARVAVILGVVALCGWALLPKDGPDGTTRSALDLGLDLQGGMHLAIEVSDTTLSESAQGDAVERVLTTIRNRINEFGVREPTIQRVGNDRIIVELAGIDDPDRAKEIVSRTAFLEFKIVRTGEDFRDRLTRIDRAIVAAGGGRELADEQQEAADEGGLGDLFADGAEEGDREEAEGLTAAGDTAARATGSDADTSPSSGFPGSSGGEELRPLTRLLLESGQEGEFLVAEQDFPTAEKYLSMDTVQALLPRDTELKWGVRPVGQGGNTYRRLYVLQSESMITGEYLADAGPATRDPTYNQPVVPFEMTRRGARIFERQTSRHVGDRMAIVLDNRVQSAPVIRQTLSRRAQIEMGAGGTFQEAQDLALVLRAGALPVPIRIVEERTVGPSLGADAIRQGKIAFGIGIVLVILMMIAYYRVAGAMAIGALGIYVLLLLGGLAGLEATLTLPGIAGIILSVGMAVDANVLIFERIREELAAGKTSRTAVEEGFSHALSAIVDANLTTLITAIILYQVGTGPVKGFAVTLGIGIVASFFTALYVTRSFFMIYLDRRAPTDPVSI